MDCLELQSNAEGELYLAIIASVGRSVSKGVGVSE